MPYTCSWQHTDHLHSEILFFPVVSSPMLTFVAYCFSLPLLQNTSTLSEIQRLVDEGNEEELIARLGSRMAFGTAGTYAQQHHSAFASGHRLLAYGFHKDV